MFTVNENIREVKSLVRTTNEVTRCMTHSLPLKHIPILMVMNFLLASKKQLNYIPSLNRISNTLSSATIVVGYPGTNCNIITRIVFGIYAQVNDELNSTNGQTQRTTGSIDLHPVGNEQVSYYFIPLTTYNHFNRRTWTELSMVNDVIAATKAMSLVEGQPMLGRYFSLFEWIPGASINNYHPVENDPPLIDEVDNYKPKQ